VPRHPLLVTAVVAVVAALWLTAPAGSAALGSTAILTGLGLFQAWAVTSPRSQWMVPTRHRGRAEGDGVALTFDDGPDPTYTPRVLDLLRQHGARATFFMVGHRVAAHPDLVRRVLAEGHLLGSHSWSHRPGFHFQRCQVMAEDIHRGALAIRDAAGCTPLAFRPPLGLRVPRLRRALARVPLPLTCFTWTARGRDAVPQEPAAIVARLLPALFPGAILALHDGTGLGGSDDRAPTLAALERLLPLVAARGLRCVRLDELSFATPWRAWLEPGASGSTSATSATVPIGSTV